MPRIVRKESPRLQTDYRAYKPFLREDFSYRCAYCTIHEYTWGSHVNFDIDHFRPKSLAQFRHLLLVYTNLYWTCNRCNRSKGKTWPTSEQWTADQRFIDPCEESPTRHFYDDGTGQLVATNVRGVYTVRHIRLNRPDLVWLRQRRRAALKEIAVTTRRVRQLRKILPGAADDAVVIQDSIANLERLVRLLIQEHFRPLVPPD